MTQNMSMSTEARRPFCCFSSFVRPGLRCSSRSWNSLLANEKVTQSERAVSICQESRLFRGAERTEVPGVPGGCHIHSPGRWDEPHHPVERDSWVEGTEAVSFHSENQAAKPPSGSTKWRSKTFAPKNGHAAKQSPKRGIPPNLPGQREKWSPPPSPGRTSLKAPDLPPPPRKPRSRPSGYDQRRLRSSPFPQARTLALRRVSTFTA